MLGLDDLGPDRPREWRDRGPLHGPRQERRPSQESAVLHHDSIDGLFDTNLWAYPDNWKLAVSQGGGPKTDELDGPAVGPGKSLTLKWTTSFVTPFDPHYTIDITGTDVAGSDVTWTMWTNDTFCF